MNNDIDIDQAAIRAYELAYQLSQSIELSGWVASLEDRLKKGNLPVRSIATCDEFSDAFFKHLTKDQDISFVVRQASLSLAVGSMVGLVKDLDVIWQAHFDHVPDKYNDTATQSILKSMNKTIDQLECRYIAQKAKEHQHNITRLTNSPVSQSPRPKLK